MFSAKSVLLERFNVVVNKKWEQANDATGENPERSDQARAKNPPLDKDYFSRNKNIESFEKLEQRITGLEHQNDQLLSFINFLLDNLPDLVINIIHSNNETNIELDLQGENEQKKGECFERSCCEGIVDPCPTRREREVLELLVKGYCAKEIANRLFISETTVITHKKNLKEKFSAKNTVELISKAQPHLSKKK